MVYVGRRSLSFEEATVLRDQIAAEYDRELVAIEGFGEGFRVVVASKQTSRQMVRVITIEQARDYLKLVRCWAQMPEPNENSLQEAPEEPVRSRIPEGTKEPVFGPSAS
jgi:hypothetical protein